MNLGFTYLEDFEELGEAQVRKEKPIINPLPRASPQFLHSFLCSSSAT